MANTDIIKRESEVLVKDGIAYTKSNNRMRYDPEYHENHGKLWTTKDIIYLCGMWKSAPTRTIALCLGRTESTCLTKVYKLKQRGQFEEFRKMFKVD